jgi:response regulator of citrate/malate metabolism
MLNFTCFLVLLVKNVFLEDVLIRERFSFHHSTLAQISRITTAKYLEYFEANQWIAASKEVTNLV